MIMYLFWVVSILVLIHVETSNAYTNELNMGYLCPASYQVYHPNENLDYKLVWNGGRITNDCKYRFLGRGDDILDEYKVCIDVDRYALIDCDVRLQIYIGYSSYPSFTYSCNDSPKRICAEVDQRISVELSTMSTFFFTPKVYYENSELTLRVTATKIYNYSHSVGIIVGAVVGSIALLVIVVIITLLIICNRRKRNTNGCVYNSRAQTVTTVTTGTTGNQYPPGYSAHLYTAQHQQPGCHYSEQQTAQQYVPPQGTQTSTNAQGKGNVYRPTAFPGIK